MKIGIFGSSYQAGKQNSIKELFDRLKAMDADIWVEKHFYNYLSKQFAYTPQILGLINSDKFPLDLVISLGGDGTFLQTAAWVSNQNIPILGINTGRLGFLADINTDEIADVINEIEQKEYKIEERTLLQIKHLTARNQNGFALNEVALLKRDTSAMISISTYLNDDFLTEYLSDGLLIATPTGSTAYSLSVNGPILIPQSKNFVLSPVAPHSLNVRPLVIPDDYTLRFKVESRSKNFLISLDGRSEVYPSGSEFRIEKADFKLKIIKRTGQTFYQTLRNKLYWGTDARK
ncbi:NAD kinase [Bacteroidales bacterium OttesenSCG-928-M11]|nr:NAD kinase [Bacteroidales bacterium OttesenSCG-928-M11]